MTSKKPVAVMAARAVPNLTHDNFIDGEVDGEEVEAYEQPEYITAESPKGDVLSIYTPELEEAERLLKAAEDERERLAKEAAAMP